MIAPEWRRIAGLHVQDEGEIAAVWLAHDRETDVLHCYDSVIFRREVMAVIGEGINNRGRWIPVAWEKTAKEVADKLLYRGCNMLLEAEKETQAVREVTSRDIWERMRTGRFKVDKRLSEWLDEYRQFYREDAQVPNSSHPLMAATRHAVAHLDYAKRQAPKGKPPRNFPPVSII